MKTMSSSLRSIVFIVIGFSGMFAEASGRYYCSSYTRSVKVYPEGGICSMMRCPSYNKSETSYYLMYVDGPKNSVVTEHSSSSDCRRALRDITGEGEK